MVNQLRILFYIAYLFILPFLLKQKRIFLLVLLALIAQIALILFFAYCSLNEARIEKIALIAFGKIATMQNGYQDSLLRWFYYFNPITNLPAFFFGCVAAHSFLLKKHSLHLNESKRVGSISTYISIVSVLAVHSWLYIYLAPKNGFVGRTASSLDAPIMAILIFCLARYPFTYVNHMFSLPFFVKLGEASYSIYLLHAFFGFHWRRYYHFHLNPWLLFVIAMCCILLVSRLSFLIYEKPVQKWLRKKLLNSKSLPHTINHEAFSEIVPPPFLHSSSQSDENSLKA